MVTLLLPRDEHGILGHEVLQVYAPASPSLPGLAADPAGALMTRLPPSRVAEPLTAGLLLAAIHEYYRYAVHGYYRQEPGTGWTVGCRVGEVRQGGMIKKGGGKAC